MPDDPTLRAHPTTSGDRPPSDDLATAGAMTVLRRGLRATPELLDGLKVTAALGIGAAVGQIAAPVVIQQAIQRGGLADGDVRIDTVWRLVIIGAVVILLSQLFGLFARRQMIRRAESSLRSLRLQVFDHVHRMSLSQHNEQPTGILLSLIHI